MTARTIGPWAVTDLLAERSEIVTSLRELRDLHAELIKDLGSCDHSVGICMCVDICALNRATEILERFEP